MRVAIAYRDAGEATAKKFQHRQLRRRKNEPPLLASISILTSLKWQLFLGRWCELASHWRIEVLS
jgi:hypothetical protein